MVKYFKKVLCIFMVILYFPVTMCYASADNENDLVFPESFSQDNFSFNKTTGEEYLKISEFLTDKNIMQYFYGIPFSFKNKEDALLYGLGRSNDGSAIRTTKEDAVSYTIRCEEQNNEIIGLVSFGYPSTGNVTTYGSSGEVVNMHTVVDMNVSYFIGNDFRGHRYGFRAVKALIDKFYKLNEESEAELMFSFECASTNEASLKTIKMLGATQLSDDFIDEYRYNKRLVSDTMCEVEVKQLRDGKEFNFSYCLPKNILHDCLMNLPDGECWTVKEYKFYYEKNLDEQ